jgi:membrane protease YdiL (CAAX protease family)
MPTPLEIAVAVLVAVVWPAWEHFVAWPRFVARVRGAAPDGRLVYYRITLAIEWGLAAAVGIAAWLARRPATSLGLAVRPGLALGVGLAACAVMVVLVARQIAKVRASASVRQAVRRQLSRTAGLEILVPRTPVEFRTFVALSVTAGVCEEFLFRGFLIAVLAAFIPAWLGAVVSAVFFGFGHSYQGGKGILSTGMVGLVMGLLYVWAGSLLPVVLLHVAVDAGNGLTTYLAMRPE